MADIRNFEELIRKFDDSIANYQGRIDALKKIEFPTKKDGTEFSQFSKNFTNCKIQTATCSINPHNKELTYYYRDSRNYHLDDYISLYEYIDTMAKDDPRREKANPHESLVRDSYSLTVQETKQKILDTIALFEGYKVEQIRLKEQAIADYEQIKAKVNELHELIRGYKAPINDFSKSDSLYYAFCDLAEYGVRNGLR